MIADQRSRAPSVSPADRLPTTVEHPEVEETRRRREQMERFHDGPAARDPLVQSLLQPLIEERFGDPEDVVQLDRKELLPLDRGEASFAHRSGAAELPASLEEASFKVAREVVEVPPPGLDEEHPGGAQEPIGELLVLRVAVDPGEPHREQPERLEVPFGQAARQDGRPMRLGARPFELVALPMELREQHFEQDFDLGEARLVAALRQLDQRRHEGVAGADHAHGEEERLERALRARSPVPRPGSPP